MSSFASTTSCSPFFIRELRDLARFLGELGMSSEMINMTVAARAGLPVAPVDPKSPIFVWEKGEGDEAPAPEAQPRSLDECREAVLREVVGLEFDKIAHVLSSALNIALAQSGDQATVILRPLVVYREADDKI